MISIQSLVGEGARAVLRTYLAELADQRRASPHTIAAYGRDLAALLEQAGQTSLDALRTGDIRRFVARFHSKGMGGRSLARRLSAWRAFYRWLVQRRVLKDNPCQHVAPPKAKRALPAVLSPDQAGRLLDIEVAELLEVRDKAMFELFYSSGLRLAELAALDLGSALDLVAGEVTVTGKRRKTRLVPVGVAARAAVQAWLERRGELAGPDQSALFISKRGTRLSMRMIQVRLALWAQRRGICERVHPHVLRHSFASHVLQSSGDLRAVQEMLGHANIGTTQVYTHLDFQHLAKVYDAAHPRAKKKS